MTTKKRKLDVSDFQDSWTNEFGFVQQNDDAAQTSFRRCGGELKREGGSSGVVLVTPLPSIAKRPRVAEQCKAFIQQI
ncbi:hypothetical protein TNCV_2116811 [Trichonephila clavipes]|nr:hypothetical protein TNCV_2116811 [Trichonephila clavipes]